MTKRISCRAIIFKKDALATMHRIKLDREYYTYPGGGYEESDKNYETCIKREVMEEFGIEINAVKLVYEYHSEDSIQYFYLCKYVSGIFGSGKGPEIINYVEKKGHYIPTLQKIYELDEIELEPKKITEQLKKDIKQYGMSLNNEVKVITE